MDEIKKLAQKYGLDFNNETGAFSDATATGAKQPFLTLGVLLICIMLPALLIGFFVYKLVKSLRDKEKAKEEKKKLKQQRKEKENMKKTNLKVKTK